MNNEQCKVPNFYIALKHAHPKNVTHVKGDGLWNGDLCIHVNNIIYDIEHFFLPRNGNLLKPEEKNGRRKLNCYHEKKIGGILYKVHSSFDGDASFRELYEDALAVRLLKIYAQRCAEGAAG